MQLFHVFLTLSCIAICLLSCSFFYLLLESHQRYFFVHWKCKYCSCRWVNKKNIQEGWRYRLFMKIYVKNTSKAPSKGNWNIFSYSFDFFFVLTWLLWVVWILIYGVCCEKKKSTLNSSKNSGRSDFPLWNQYLARS